MTAVVVATLLLVAVLVSSPGADRRARSALALAGSRVPVVVVRRTDVALLVDLVAAAMSAGATPVAALQTAGRAVDGAGADDVVRVAARLRLGSDWDGAWAGTDAELEPLRRCLGLAMGTGAPGAGLLRDTATELRRRRHRASQLEASRLGVRLVLPLGLCALPAFLALGVVPVVLSLAGQVLAPAP